VGIDFSTVLVPLVSECKPCSQPVKFLAHRLKQELQLFRDREYGSSHLLEVGIKSWAGGWIGKGSSHHEPPIS
jgi:hypothetical protein